MTIAGGNSSDLESLERDAVLREDAGWELIVAGGADRSRFLHGIVTADVAGTPPGSGRRSLLLTPKGHIVADLRLFVRPDDFWIVVDRGQGRPVADALGRYAIMDDFTAVPREDFALLSLLGPAAAARLGAIGIVAGPLGEASVYAHGEVPFDGGSVWLARVRELGVPGFWVGGPRTLVAEVRARLRQAGVAELPAPSAEAARIAALEPRFGFEITADYFPMEVGLDSAIDYRKGCYLGQEPIVRIRDRGHINWRLAGLEVAGPGEIAPKDALESDVKPKAGRVTSFVRLPDGRGVALAMLHVSVPVGATIRIRPAEGGGAPVEAQVRADAASVTG